MNEKNVRTQRCLGGLSGCTVCRERRLLVLLKMGRDHLHSNSLLSETATFNLIRELSLGPFNPHSNQTI
ncbi:hypothetical protein HBH56_026580 [Parastagonospora nodorum]|uniref:Uncharacterized protein n=1 Tax=Phaeosphaeria nodorum (strain SN15 / ATCC MYA-4574 / FGSC 10173) TaxID=321614 RepID=A0A7U2F583_PHANO|nr:hypothetical protein HBH56_026580 [Parastagonospora nodorum]QRC98966.1 hypothetical protein JI435_412870 [Parastagonospora nodorum SN15]KAH3934562.1 hypothetical protein HBH54_055460 [Parastagonospora nodorum]KAH4142041.1 hypothetical protein HBH45_061320 [Parastagonospora nodorum]KAH4161654.1 hypothetical protein HBH44_094910 [Parastagonospora nodorum]